MINYSRIQNLTPEEFIDVLERSTLAERRPVESPECIKGMIENANLMIGAYHGEKLIGIARSVTDFWYCCYLSDLAVDISYQKQGVGKRLLQETRKFLQPKCSLILLSAPKANEYYPKIGFTKHESAWWLLGHEELS